MIQYIYDAMVAVLSWFLGLFTEAGSAIVFQLFTMLPPHWDTSAIAAYSAHLVAWIPVDFLMAAWGTWLTVKLAAAGIRWALAFVPTLG